METTAWPFDIHNRVSPAEVSAEANRDPRVRDVESLRVPDNVAMSIAQRKVNVELAALRITSPYLPVTCLPSRTKVFVAAVVNDRRDIQLPSDAELVQFYAPSGVVFYVSFGGAIVYPVAESDPLNGWSDCLVSPIGQWFYIGTGSKSISLGLPFAGQVVSIGVI